jgi:hypothetical protein
VALAALLLLVPLLAGCAAPEEDKPDPLFGLCPQWTQGPGAYAGGFHAANESVGRELGPANETYLGKPLDLFRVRLDKVAVDGRLELRAEATDGKQLAIRDYRQEAPQLVPVVVLTDGSAAGHEFDVLLSPILHGAAAAPAPVTLRFNVTGDAAVEFSATYHYKVCGL